MPALIKQLGIRVPAALGQRLEAQALRENNLISAVARRLLTLALDREDAARSATSTPKGAA